MPAFYEAETRNLGELGFRQNGDFINETAVAAMPGTRVVLRVFLSQDGTVMAAAYDVRFGGWIRLLQLFRLLPRDLRCVELETEFSDGSFASTSNAFEASKALEFPHISRRFLAARTPATTLFSEHTRHLADVRAARPDATPLVFRTLEELFGSQDRMHVIKSRHRSSKDFDMAAAVERVAGRPLNEREREMSDEAARVHTQRVGDRSDS